MTERLKLSQIAVVVLAAVWGMGCDTNNLGDGLGGKGNGSCLDCHAQNGSLAFELEIDGDGGMAGTPTEVDLGHTIHRDLRIGCETCHVKPQEISDSGHITGLPADVVFSGGAALGGLTPVYNAETRRCEGTYCHGGGMIGGAINAPSFLDITGAGLACDSCHGNPAVSSAHPAHNRAELGCSECHIVPVRPTDEGHIDGPPADVTFGPKARLNGATPTWDPNTRTCSGIYCHGATLAVAGANKTPVWAATGTPSASCDSCHGNPSPETHLETATDCYPCHPMTVNPDNSINVEGKFHINGVVDY